MKLKCTDRVVRKPIKQPEVSGYYAMKFLISGITNRRIKFPENRFNRRLRRCFVAIQLRTLHSDFKNEFSF